MKNNNSEPTTTHKQKYYSAKEIDLSDLIAILKKMHQMPMYQKQDVFRCEIFAGKTIEFTHNSLLSSIAEKLTNENIHYITNAETNINEETKYDIALAIKNRIIYKLMPYAVPNSLEEAQIDYLAVLTEKIYKSIASSELSFDSMIKWNNNIVFINNNPMLDVIAWARRNFDNITQLQLDKLCLLFLKHFTGRDEFSLLGEQAATKELAQLIFDLNLTDEVIRSAGSSQNYEQKFYQLLDDPQASLLLGKL